MEISRAYLQPVIKTANRNILFLAAAALFVTLIAIKYVQSERFFYYWDFGGYHGVSSEVTEAFSRSVSEGRLIVLDSIDQEYNTLFVLPLLPFTLTFGTSRLVYILGIVWVYLLPTALVFGKISTLLFEEGNSRIFWPAVFVTLLIPSTWASVLRGYPDMGGVLLLSLGLLFFLLDVELTHWWQILFIGFFLAAAPIFRRHFAYASLAFFIAASIYYGVNFVFGGIQTKSFAWRKLLREMLSLFLTGVVSLVVIFLTARSFLERALITDYNALYLSYTKSPLSVLTFFQQEFGWLIWIMAFIGFAAGFVIPLFRRDLAFFILLLGACTILLWVIIVRQSGPHYVPQILFLIVIGIVSLVNFASKGLGSWARPIALAGVLGLVLFNLAYSLAPINFVPHRIKPLLSWVYRPLFRTDYDEVINLLQYLRGLPEPRNPVYVVDSSELMNNDLLRKAEQALYGDDLKLEFQETPQVDSRDYYPLEQLVQARYVIVSSPLQTHIDPEQQKVVRFVYDVFMNDLEISRDFSEIDGTFKLAGGVTLHVFKRERPTSLETSIRTFHGWVKFMNRKPGEQRDWLVLNLDAGDLVQQTNQSSYRFFISNKKTKEGRTFLYSEPIRQGGFLQGKLMFKNKQCPGATVTVNLLDPAGKIVDSQTILVDPEKNSFESDKISPFMAGSYLSFQVKQSQKPGPASVCSLSVLWKLRND